MNNQKCAYTQINCYKEQFDVYYREGTCHRSFLMQLRYSNDAKYYLLCGNEFGSPAWPSYSEREGKKCAKLFGFGSCMNNKKD